MLARLLKLLSGFAGNDFAFLFLSLTPRRISGAVLNPNHLPTAYAIANNDTVTSSPVVTTSGFFRLAFLPAQIHRDRVGHEREVVYAGECGGCGGEGISNEGNSFTIGNQCVE